MVVLLLAIECNHCGQIFYLCQSCYRGQCYCCNHCRSTAQRAAHCQAQQRYRQTEKGRKAHCRAEQRRRLKKNRLREKNMDDEGSTPGGSHGSLVTNQPKSSFHCSCCGADGLVVNQFPRRGYGRSPSSDTAALQSSGFSSHYGKKTASQPRTCP